ncbi:MAG: hypothetical protein GPOALKHO_000940 [Sodalis sp.]|nr:MAG: hypothetical protein GPOALKHO_000940 [Sodalis sp.]
MANALSSFAVQPHAPAAKISKTRLVLLNDNDPAPLYCVNHVALHALLYLLF